jgi:predicted dehydrogenase
MPEPLQYEPILPEDLSTPIGCLGAGFIMNDCHLVAYRNQGFNPIAIADPDTERANAAAERHKIGKVYASSKELIADRNVKVLDIGVPPDNIIPVIHEAIEQKDHIRAILCQKPLGGNLREAMEIEKLCREAGIVLAVNQNMRYDQSIRACKDLLNRGVLGDPVLATIDMRAIPHWMPWQERQGWCSLRIMSIHHLDTFRFWFGDPDRIFASTRPDPRTKFPHTDGICLYILEYDDNSMRASAWDDVWSGPALEGAGDDIAIRWRVEGTKGLARGTIGWPKYPERTPSTLDYTTIEDNGEWHEPRWNEVWFPDAFAGPMAELLVALENNELPSLIAADNLKTMALVEAAYESATTHNSVNPAKYFQS